MRYTLLNIEKKISDFFEDHNPLSNRKSVFTDLMIMLIEAIDTKILDLNGRRIAPNIFTLKIDEQLKVDFSAFGNWIKDLQSLIEEVISENDLVKQGPLTIQIKWIQNRKKPISVIAEHTSAISGNTIQLNGKEEEKISLGSDFKAMLLFTDGEKYKLQEGLTTIGRETENDLTIDNLLLSRQHARITIQNNQAIIADLSSINGTFVNGNKIEKHVLLSGDVITLGDVSMIYITDDDTGNYSPTTRKIEIE
jgi:hypothetical protein